MMTLGAGEVRREVGVWWARAKSAARFARDDVGMGFGVLVCCVATCLLFWIRFFMCSRSSNSRSGFQSDTRALHDRCD